MLVGLDIRDILIIDHAEILFTNGLNVLTGETGAGKSILLDSLGFVLGWRGKTEIVRPGADFGEVSVWFELKDDHPVRKILDDNNVPWEGELLIRRVINVDGRKTAWINGRRAPRDLLIRISTLLVEIHGQHDDKGLLDQRSHIRLLDMFAGNSTQRERVKEAWKKLKKAKEVMSSIISNKHIRSRPKYPSLGKREKVFEKEFNRISIPQHMGKLINYALTDILLQYPNTVVFGEDVAQKGGVYHVTADLYKQFGIRRVFNSPLDETSIIGFGLGLGHNGFVPIPEIQFLAYLHNAEDQLRGEAATLPFFSEGRFTNPMVLRIPGLAYQKGFGGHFHNDNSLTIFRDIPGLILAVPSNGADAAKMLRTSVREAYENGRVVIFIEPIALYMTRDLYTEKDGKWLNVYPDIKEEVAVGEFMTYGNGRALTIITYGNGLYLSLKAKKAIESKTKKKIKVIDLRWLAPINIPKIIASIGRCNKILIVDECRRTGCHGENIYLKLSQNSNKKLNIKLHAAEDSFIPLGESAAATLPSEESIINSALDLLSE